MAKLPEIKRRARRIAAKRLAAEEGANWEKLSVEQRMVWVQRTPGKVNEDDRKKAVVSIAKRRAKQAGSKWNELSKEQQKSLIETVRSASQD
jgi:hypothetical protein